MILFVDIEHESGFSQPHGEALLAGRARITYGLQDVSGHVCLLQRYGDVTADLIDRYEIAAMFLSGNSADPARYDAAEKQRFLDIIAASTIPVFGFCGGHQWLAQALGVEVTRVGRIAEGEEDPVPQYQPGWRKEVGYQPVRHVADHPVLDGVDPASRYRMAHTWEVATLPDGFETIASTDVSPIQLMVNDERRMVGTQFHPEYWNDKDPAGRQLIANFCAWAGV